MTLNQFVFRLSHKLSLPQNKLLNAHTDDKGRHRIRVDGILFTANSLSNTVTVIWGDGHKAITTL